MFQRPKQNFTQFTACGKEPIWLRRRGIKNGFAACCVADVEDAAACARQHSTSSTTSLSSLSTASAALVGGVRAMRVRQRSSADRGATPSLLSSSRDGGRRRRASVVV